MFVSTNCIKIQSGRGADLEELFRRQGRVEHQPGFHGFELWKQNGDADHKEYLVVTHWDSKDNNEQRTQSETFRQAHSGEHPAFIIAGESHTYDARISSRPKGSKIWHSSFSSL